jgi:hypothetical protein
MKKKWEACVDDLKNNNNEYSNVRTRRSFLLGTGAAAVGFALLYVHGRQPLFAVAAAAGRPKIVTIVDFSDSGDRGAKKSVERITKSDEEWKKQLSPLSF